MGPPAWPRRRGLAGAALALVELHWLCYTAGGTLVPALQSWGCQRPWGWRPQAILAAQGGAAAASALQVPCCLLSGNYSLMSALGARSALSAPSLDGLRSTACAPL
eukprot:5413879-Alexandrium_andersonii.AAC.1